MQHIHFVGIGGIGVSAVAELAIHNGITVSGQDISPSSTISRLQSLGAKIQLGSFGLPDEPVNAVVRSTAIKDDHPAIIAGRNASIPIIHRSEFLQHLASDKQTIAITGTHGKTSTAALITHMLEKLGLKPSAAIGGVLLEFGTNALSGTGSLIVIEADESDGTFLNYEPYISIVTNIDRDHMDFYGTQDQQYIAFKKFMDKTSDEGACIVCWDNRDLRNLSEGLASRLTYGSALGSEIRLIKSTPDKACVYFEAVVERDLVKCNLPMMGRHNVLNALAALAVARCLELDVHAASDALESFQGVEKRMNLLYESDELKILMDYAHNPGKVAAAIAAVNDGFPDHRLLVVFQPHRFSRLESTFEEQANAFHEADSVFVTSVYGAGEAEIAGVNHQTLASAIEKQSHINVTAVDEYSDVIRLLHESVKVSKQACVILIVGAGDIYHLGPDLVSFFQRSIRGAETKSRK